MSQQPTPLPPSAAQDDISGGIKGFFIVVSIVTIVSISLRFWSRLISDTAGRNTGRRTQRLWWDDWAALAAVPFILALCGLAFAMGVFGLGHHAQFVEPKNLFIFLRLLYAEYYIYDIGLFFTKLSVLLFFSRIFPWHINSNWFNYAIVATHCLNCAWLIGIIFGTVFMCNPVEKGWNPTLPGHCGTTSALWIGSAIPSVTIDLIILVLPLPKIWSLQMTKTRKLAIIGIFLIGYRLITVVTTGSTLNEDITYSVVHLAYWVGAEAPITMVGICLPPMAALGRRLVHNYSSILSSKFHSIFSSRKSGDGTEASTSHSATDSQSQNIPLGTSFMKNSVDNDACSVASQGSSANLFHHTSQHFYAGARIDPSYPRRGIHGTSPPSNAGGDAAIRVDRAVTVRQSMRR